MIRTASILAASATILCLASAPATAAQDPNAALSVTASKPAARSLVIIVRGLPGTALGRVKISGPGSYRTTVTANGKRTLTGLKPGTYRVTAKAVQTSFGKATVKKSKRSVKVKANKGAKVVIAYDVPGTS
jgi:hypothetical protein